MRMVDYFERGWRRAPDRPAFVDDERTLTWREVNDLSGRVASAMVAAGLPDLARVSVYAPNCALAFVPIIASFRIGAVWVPMNARNTIESNEHMLRLTGCSCLFYHSTLEQEALALKGAMDAPAQLVCLDRDGPGNIPSLEAFMRRGAGATLPDVPDDSDRVVRIMPTGGTTGLSKGAEQTQLTWETVIATYWLCLPSDEPPVHLVAGPLTHGAGSLALMMMSAGPTNILLKKAEPARIMEAIERHRVTHVYLPPTLVYLLLAHPQVRSYDFSSLKYLLITAAPIAPDKLREAMQVFGPVVCQSYGQAEAPIFLTFLSTRDLIAAKVGGRADRWASCGRPTLSSSVEIMGDDGRILEPYERGELVARGNLAVPRYHKNPAATAEMRTFGWLHTGDIGYRDEDGFFYLVDRKKDMIVTGGFNVYTAEIEQVILSHPAVRDCAVIGVPDPKWGEAVKVVVELKDGASTDGAELTNLVRQKLGGVHAPKSVEFWTTLPRSVNGKVLKREIRARFWQSHDRAI